MKKLFLPESTSVTSFAVVGNLWTALVLYLLAINFLSFLLMGIDKLKAKKENARRIPEKTLFLFALLGGSVGSILGMRIFHHKTKHWYFVWGMPIILIAQIALAVWLLM